MRLEPFAGTRSLAADVSHAEFTAVQMGILQSHHERVFINGNLQAFYQIGSRQWIRPPSWQETEASLDHTVVTPMFWLDSNY